MKIGDLCILIIVTSLKLFKELKLKLCQVKFDYNL